MIHETINGVQCTPEEESLIRSLERLARRWKKDGTDLMLFVWSNNGLRVVKVSETQNSVSEGVVACISGIMSDCGDPD